MEEKSLFEKIGGKEAVDAAVELFYEKILSDEKISHFFTKTDMSLQKAKQKAFLSYAFGAKTNYTGKKMRDAHKHMQLSEEHFSAVAGHLVSTLEDLKVPQNLIDEVVKIAMSTKDDVLNK